SVLLSINPAVIIICGSLMNNLTRKIASSIAYRMVLPFAVAALAFIGLAWACPAGEALQPVPIFFVIGMTAAVAFAELMIGPSAYCACSEIASKQHQGMVMGLVPIGFSLASVIGGHLAKWMAIEEPDLSLEIYRDGFLTIGALLLAAAVVFG